MSDLTNSRNRCSCQDNINVLTRRWTLIWIPVRLMWFVIAFWGRREQTPFRLSVEWWTRTLNVTIPLISVVQDCRSCWFVYPYSLARAWWQRIGLLPAGLVSSESWRCCAVVVNHWSSKICVTRGLLPAENTLGLHGLASCLAMILPFDTISGSSTKMIIPRCPWEVLSMKMASVDPASRFCTLGPVSTRGTMEILEWYDKTDCWAQGHIKLTLIVVGCSVWQLTSVQCCGEGSGFLSGY